jgi:HEAT repeat protein
MPLKSAPRKQPAKPAGEAGSVGRCRDRDLAGLVLQLADSDPAVRRWAARDLARPDAIVPLCACLPQETSPAVRQAIFDSLAAIGSAEVVAAVLPFLRSEDAALRNGAVSLLQELPEPVARHMADLLADPDPDVRILSIDILQTLAHPDVPGWLRQLLEHEADANVVGTAVDRLVETGSPELAGLLADVRRRFADEPYIQFACDLALARLGGRTA